MTSEERHYNRYLRRKTKREENKKIRCENVGDIKTAMSFNEMYRFGKKCCNGVRWKNSTQRFELHLFSNTASNYKKIIKGTWKPLPYFSFTLCERGKIRQIDAPRILDRQIHKTFTNNVLLPLYKADIIWNNGASLKEKGFHFSLNLLKKDLMFHYKKYKRNGKIILIDFKNFFPSASHKVVFNRHEKLIYDKKLKEVGKKIVQANNCKNGLPLGVEPSQIEMIALPSPLDNFIKCQLSIKGFGHYMDDYYLIVPPDKDANKILNIFLNKAFELGLAVNLNKTRIIDLTRNFKFCKAKFYLTESGKIVVNGNRDSLKRARRKIKSLKSKIDNKDISYENLWTVTNSINAYFRNYNDHNRILKLRRLFYSLYGFSCEKLDNFRKRDNKNEIYNT